MMMLWGVQRRSVPRWRLVLGEGVSKEECVFCGAPMVIGSRDLGVRGVQRFVFVAPPWRLVVDEGCPKKRVYLWRLRGDR